MRPLNFLLALARPRSLVLGLALGCVAAMPAVASAQDPGALTPDELAVPAPADEATVDEPIDVAEAGDIALDATEIQNLQDRLKELGYFYGPADGRKGPRTRTAVRNFQRDHGLDVTGSIDATTFDRVAQEAAQAEVAPGPATVDPDASVPSPASASAQEPAAEPTQEPEAVPAAEPAAVSAPEPAAASTHSSSRARRVGGALKTAGGATVSGVKTAGGATVTGVKTGAGAIGTASSATGEAVGKAGAATGKAAGTAGTSTAKATVVAAKATATGAKSVAKGTVYVVTQSRDFILGDRHGGSDRSDAEIKAAIERQFVDEPRIVPSEIDVRVSHGNVTLALPEGAQTDVTHAVRLAKLTPGVQTVTTVATSVTETGEGAK